MHLAIVFIGHGCIGVDPPYTQRQFFPGGVFIFAAELCDGRLLLCQEGGYAITYTGFCMYAVAEGVLGVETPMDDPLAYDATIEQPNVPLAAISHVGARWRELVGA